MEPLIAPVLDFVCPPHGFENPEWISRLHSFLLACCDPYHPLVSITALLLTRGTCIGMGEQMVFCSQHMPKLGTHCTIP